MRRQHAATATNHQGLEVRELVDLVSESTLLSPHSRLGF
jgi:hypothetical protein